MRQRYVRDDSDDPPFLGTEAGPPGRPRYGYNRWAAQRAIDRLDFVRDGLDIND